MNIKHLIWLFLLVLFGFSINGSSQEIAKDTIAKKDTTIVQKLEKIVQLVIEDTISKKETKKDSLLEKKLDKKFYGFLQFKHETSLFIETPIKWHKTDWARLGLIVAATVAIMPLDQNFDYVTQTHKSYYYTLPVVIGNIYGEWYFTGTLIAVSAGYTLMTHNIEAEKV